jgi:hypothetical protein
VRRRSPSRPARRAPAAASPPPAAPRAGFIGSYQLGNNVTTIDNEATDVAYTPTRAGVPYAA